MLRVIAKADSSAARFAMDLLGEANEEVDVIWPEPEQYADVAEDALSTVGPLFDPTDNSLAFKIESGPLKGWEFHQADDDFFPSIPHGHEYGRKQPKLDAYLGWVYRKDQQIRRIDRTSIVNLWNDRDFRDFARVAIEYYLNRFPKYEGWRVSDPLTLPAIRRGRRHR